MKYIFIDASYFIFFRFHALTNWWSLARKDEPLVQKLNTDFIEKFRKTFCQKIKEVASKVGIKKGVPYKIFVGKDCPRSHIWRTPLFDSYKEGRADSSMEGHFFELVYKEKLFEQLCGENCILFHPHLEADDVIALTVKKVLEKNEEDECYIITSDMDYIQLASPRVHLFDLKYKDLTSKSKYYQETGTPDKDMFIKYICGDKSDNIPSIFVKCGKKTAEKLWDMNEKDRLKVIIDKGGVQQFEKNKQLICFDNIPEQIKNEFFESLNVKQF